MHKIQKILGGIFLGGVLLGGIGTGVALVEYTSLAYAGEMVIGEEDLAVRELDYTFTPGEEEIKITKNYPSRDAVLEADNRVPEGTVRYVVTYNKKIIRPILDFWEETPETEEEPTGPFPRQIRLCLGTDYTGSDIALFIESKDEILTGLKEKKIFDYKIAYITDVKIRVNPQSLPWVTFDK